MSVEFGSMFFRFSLATAFLLAGLVKIGKREAFETAVRRFGLIPRRYSKAVARWLPVFEATVGVMLGLGILTLIAASSLGLALLLFTGAVTVNLLKGRKLECGCFGQFAKPITWFTVLRNLGLLAMATVVIAVRPRALSVASLGGSTAEGISMHDAAAALVSATLLVLGTLLLSQARSLWRSADVVLKGETP